MAAAYLRHTLTPEDLAAAYKQLIAVERGWRDMKGALQLRPVFHYREDRIRAHDQLCWLALLLLRVIENATGDTWRNLHHELDRMHLVTLATNAGQVAQRSATTPGQQAIFGALDLREPPSSSTSPPPAADPRTAARSNTLTCGELAFPQVNHRFTRSCAHDLRKSGQSAVFVPLQALPAGGSRPGRARTGGSAGTWCAARLGGCQLSYFIQFAIGSLVPTGW